MKDDNCINISALKDKKLNIVPLSEAIKDIVPLPWDDTVQDGNKKVVIEPK